MAKVVKVACAPYNLYAWIIGMTLLLREPQISSRQKLHNKLKVRAKRALIDLCRPLCPSRFWKKETEHFLPVSSFEKLEVIMMIDKLSPTLSCLPMIPTINSTHPHHNTSDSTQFGAATSKHQYHWVTLYHHSKKNQKKMKKARTKNPSFGANGCFLLQIN